MHLRILLCNTIAERVEMVRGCRWVDEVVPNVPYIMNQEYLAYVIDKYKIDYVVHGTTASAAVPYPTSPSHLI
jgi:choline-phosphate cytidylyltransferase